MRALGRRRGSLLRNARSRLRSESGWTLNEMLIAILVSSIVLGAATTLLTGVASLNGTTDRQNTAADTTRTAMENMATQMRNAAEPPGASRPFYALGTTMVQFYAPNSSVSTANNPRGLQWVQYCLDYSNRANEKLWLQTNPYDSVSNSTPPGGSTCPNAGWATQELVASNIVNQACGGAPCNPANTPVFTQKIDAQGAITDVLVRLLVQGDSAHGPTTLTTSIDARNRKASPNATVTCTSQNGHAICDASASTDPDGEALSYQWQMACCSTNNYTSWTEPWESGQTGYLFDHGGLTGGTTYKVIVEVTNKSGLFTDANTTVTIQ
jgi:Tfp pilus assembly protein PilV